MSFVTAVAQTMSSNMAKNKKLNYKNINAKSVANNLSPKELKNQKNISTATALYAQADLI